MQNTASDRGTVFEETKERVTEERKRLLISNQAKSLDI